MLLFGFTVNVMSEEESGDEQGIDVQDLRADLMKVRADTMDSLIEDAVKIHGCTREEARQRIEERLQQIWGNRRFIEIKTKNQ